jgi:hypothetical protein
MRLDSSLKFVEPVARRNLSHWSSNIIKLENTTDSVIKEVNIERVLKKEANFNFKVRLQHEGLIQFKH